MRLMGLLVGHNPHREAPDPRITANHRLAVIRLVLVKLRTVDRASERCGQTPVVVLSSSDAPADRRDAETNAAIHFFGSLSSLEAFMPPGVIVRAVIDHPS